MKSDVTDGIRDYLASGGLFNPELMDHQRVRDLLIESRDEIERLREKLAQTQARLEPIDRALSAMADKWAEIETARKLTTLA